MLPSAKATVVTALREIRKQFDALSSVDALREGWQAEVDAFEELGSRAKESDRGVERQGEIDTLEGHLDEYEGAYDSLESAISELEDFFGIKRA